MDFISLAILAVNGLRTVMSNPALGGGSSVRLDQASELLGILGVLLEQGDDAYDDLKEFTETIEDMVKKGREPSADEWDIMRGRSDEAHARLQAAKEELLAEEEPEPTPEPEPEPEPEPTPEPESEPEVVTDPTPAEDTLPDDDDPIVEPPQ